MVLGLKTFIFHGFGVSRFFPSMFLNQIPQIRSKDIVGTWIYTKPKGSWTHLLMPIWQFTIQCQLGDSPTDTAQCAGQTRHSSCTLAWLDDPIFCGLLRSQLHKRRCEASHNPRNISAFSIRSLSQGHVCNSVQIQFHIPLFKYNFIFHYISWIMGILAKITMSAPTPLINNNLFTYTPTG